MKKAHVSYRIPTEQWMNDDAFRAIVAMLADQEGGFDDVALFSAFVHTPLTLEELAKRNAVLGKRYEVLRAHGWGAGVNLLCTVGHHEENLEHIPRGYTYFTGIDGQTCAGTFCPNDPAYRQEVLIPMFQMLANARPDFIWLDDDIRWCGHGKVQLVCFCDRCMELFNRKHGTDFTRESLRIAFDTGTPEEKMALRRRHQSFSAESLNSLFQLAAETIHAVSPQIEVGAMDSGMRAGDNGDPAVFAATLAGKSGKPVRWRPGGGAYTDRTPDEFLLGKAMFLGAGTALLPDEVTNIQSEVENFNYQRLAKSRHVTAMEACLYNACGLTGAAWNVMDATADSLETFRPLLETLTRVRPFLDLQVRTHGRMRPSGIYNGWTPEWNIGRNIDSGSWTQVTGFEDPHARELFACGLPPAFRLAEARMTILNGPTAWSLSEEELLKILAGGLYCDVETLDILHRRKLGHLAGFRAVKRISADGRERLKPHPLNGTGAHYIRDCRQSFPWGHEDAWQLEAQSAACESLAELVNYQSEVMADCTLGLYTNELGGRVAVSGYYALRDLLFASKLTAMKRLFRYLSADTLPAWVDSYHRIGLFARESGAVSLVNASLDPAQDAVVAIRTAQTRYTLTDQWMNACEVVAFAREGAYGYFRLPELKPWHVYLLHGE